MGVIGLTLTGWGISALSTRPTVIPSPNAAHVETAALQSRLSDVRADVSGYLQTHDGAFLRQLNEDGKKLSSALRDVTERLDPAQGRILQTLADHMRAITLQLIQEEASAREHMERFAAAGTEFQTLLRDKARPSVKNYQANAASRREALLVAEKEAANFFRSGTLYAGFHQPAALEDARQSREALVHALDAYRRVSPSRRTEVWSEQLQQSFVRWDDTARRLWAAERGRDPLLHAYEGAYRDLSEWLRKRGETVPAKAVSKERGTGRIAFGIVLAILLCAGLGALGWCLETRVLRPMSLLTKQIDAAATGDLSREFHISYWDEIGKLGTSVNRLVGVLNRSENLVYHLATLVESSGDAIIGYTLDGTILSWNKGAQRVYGYAAEEVKGACLTILSPQDSGAELRGLLDRVKNGEKINPLDMVHQAKNGRTIQAFVRVSCIFDSTKRAIGASMCVQDMTPTDASSASRLGRYSSFSG
jgi:PAS domain S-box-containing protein